MLKTAPRLVHRFAGRLNYSSIATDPLSKMSVGELKQLLSDRGVDFRDCLEKNDLITRLQSALTSGTRPQQNSGIPQSLFRQLCLFSPLLIWIGQTNWEDTERRKGTRNSLCIATNFGLVALLLRGSATGVPQE